MNLEDTLVAGEGLGEDRRDGAAARPVVSARERKREEKSPYAREKGKGETDFTEGGEEPL